MKFSAVLLLAASANAAVMGKRFSNGAAIEAPRALDLAQDVRRAANTTAASSVVEARQAANATSLLDARQAGNATARSHLRRAAAANGTAAARSVDGKAHHLF